MEIAHSMIRRPPERVLLQMLVDAWLSPADQLKALKVYLPPECGALIDLTEGAGAT